MVDEKVITLQECVDIVKDYMAGVKTKEDLSAFGDTMTIRSYIPLLEKVRVAIAVNTHYIYTDADIHEVRVAEKYKDLFFKVIMSTYGSVDCSDTKLCTFEIYDLLYPIFSDFILSYCKSDYEQMIKFIDDCIDCYSTRSFVEAMEAIDPDVMAEATKANQELTSELGENKQLIHELKELAAYNNPLMQNALEVLQRDSIIKANEKILEEKKEKYKEDTDLVEPEEA